MGSLLAVLSAWTVAYLDFNALPWLCVISAVGLGVVRWPRWLAKIPPRVHTFVFPVIVAVFAYDLYSTRETLAAMVRLELMLLLYRMVGYRKRRDDLQIVVLGLFLVVVAGVMSVSLLFVVQIVAFTGVALGFLFLIVLADNLQTAEAALEPPGLAPRWAREVRWRALMLRVAQVTDWRVVTLAGGLFGGVVGVSALLFLAIPRFEIGSSLFLDFLAKKRTRSGFSENVRFGEITSIQEDAGLALTVDLSYLPDRSQLPVTPYWRMMVLDQYKEGEFSLSDALKPYLDKKTGTNQALVPGNFALSRAAMGEWRFYYEPGVSRYIPLAGDFGQIQFSRRVSWRRSDALRLLSLKEAPAEVLGFAVQGLALGALLPDPMFETVRREAGQPYRRLALRPDDAAALHALVSEFSVETALSSEQFARRACGWLAARHSYSMNSALPRGAADPLVRWMRSQGPGHCEFFAGAFVLLARASGYDARVVVGFKGGSWNERGQSLLVRNSDAHAWCEIWNGQDAWIRVDPTPGAISVGEPTPAEAAEEVRSRMVDTGWRAQLDALRVFWYRRVVNFDQKSQLQMAISTKQRVEQWFSAFRDELQSGFRGLVRWLQRPWSGGRVAIWCAYAAGVSLVGFLSYRLFRIWSWRLRKGWRQRQGVGPVRREAGRWLVKLNERGWSAASAGPIGPLHSELQRLRYGPEPRPTEAGQTFRRARKVWRAERRRRP